MDWYALRVKPHKERTVFERLQSEEIEVYFPQVKVKPKNPRAAKKKPYFPGYMFVHVNLEEVGFNTFNWMPGTLGLVSFDGIPASVPAKLILELQQRLAEIDAAGGLEIAGLEHGDHVRIIEGPFAGYEAIFDMRLSGSDRVQVLLAFMSKHLQPVKIDVTDIKKIEK
ncbi:MAG: transcription termination/antitermination NusG family protein [Candidatus Promineifilaceae bacterium]|nr:transcription termination/antitermination NusG family protein [Candidatus Promineifilaceae bacterium]